MSEHISSLKSPLAPILDELADLRAEIVLARKEVQDLRAEIAKSPPPATAKAFYTTAEASPMLGLSEFTVRNYCRLGRIRAQKKGSGRGKHLAWVISHNELQRVMAEGILPPRNMQQLRKGA